MKHIVVIHAGAIGDLVQALAALEAVRTTWPQVRITLVGRPERAALAHLAGVVDDCADAETCGLWRVAAGTGPGGPAPSLFAEADLVIDFLTKGALARGLATAPRAAGHVPQVVSADPLPPAEWHESAAAWVGRQVTAALSVGAVPAAPRIPLSDAAMEAARALAAARGLGEGFVAIHPGSGSAKKNWPPERFEAMAQRVRQEARRPVVWFAGPAEAERHTLPDGAAADVVLADLALDQVAGVLALAAAYLGNDSGITQVAAAVRRPDGGATPTVVLFGPTDARVWAPRGRHVRIVASPDGTMDAVAVDAVWAALRQALALPRRDPA
ncbi:MAG TPA: glycosyltransferase family 9 protein [Phycisphaerae bacterium]|nr:glycosyltransferase family 9 protein [Phycisphaerae bacterium]